MSFFDKAQKATFNGNLFLLKEQAMDKPWLFRLEYFQIFLENEPGESVT